VDFPLLNTFAFGRSTSSTDLGAQYTACIETKTTEQFNQSTRNYTSSDLRNALNLHQHTFDARQTTKVKMSNAIMFLLQFIA